MASQAPQRRSHGDPSGIWSRGGGARASPSPPRWAPIDRRWVLCAAIALSTLYLASRLWFIARFPYFADEGQFATYTQQAAHSVHKLFISEGESPELPLFDWFGIPWIKLGFNPLIAVRLVSAISGLLTVWVVALLGRRLGGPVVGLVAGALCVLLPFFVVHDGIGIYEPLVTLEIVAALYAQIELARRPGLRWGALLGVMLAGGVLTKQSTEPALVLIPVSLLCFDWSADGRRDRISGWLRGIAISALLVVGAELLLRSSHYWDQGQVLRRLGIYPARTIGQVLSDPFNGDPQHALSVFRTALVGYVTLPLLALGLLGAILAWRARPRLTAVVLVWIIVLVGVGVMFATRPYPRHVMYALPPGIVLIAYAGVQAARWLGTLMTRGRALAAAILAGVLLMAPALVFDARVLAHPSTFHYPSSDYFQYVTGQPAGGRWPDVADTIRRRATPGRVVILTPQAESYILTLLLSDDPRFQVVGGSSPLAASARFAVYETGNPFLDVAADRVVTRNHFVVVRRYQRPDGGAVITLRQRPGR